jgi:multidrug efflux pump subunit AcrA (membrane-fusion protein)
VKFALGSVILIALAGLGLWRAAPRVAAKATTLSGPEVPSTAVRRGDVTFTITARGELQGGNTQMLAVPMTGGQPAAITFLRQNGELVKEGDEVVKFDTTEQEFRLREAEADLAEAEQQIIQAKAEAEAKEEETNYELIKARADLKLAEVEMGRNELLPRLLVQQNQMALEAAQIKLAKLEKDLANRLETARSGIAIQEAARTKAKVKAETARRNIEAMTLRAKTSGYVAIQNNDEGNLRWGMYMPPYQVGDIARPGKSVAQIPDMRNWEATARIGELDRGHIAERQPSQMEVVAMPGKSFKGRIKTIGGTTGPPWDRHFDCRVAVEDPLPELRPGMSVNMRIVTGVLKDVTWIPAQALFDAEGRKFVYLQTRDGFRPKDVVLVRSSESQAVVKGLEPGQMVAMANPDQMGQKQKGGGARQALPKS